MSKNLTTVEELAEAIKINPNFIKEAKRKLPNPIKHFTKEEIENAQELAEEEIGNKSFEGIFDYNNIFRIGGHPGLWALRGMFNKGNIANFINMSDPSVNKFAHARDLTCLGDLGFTYLEDNEDDPKIKDVKHLTIDQVFNNLEEGIKKGSQMAENINKEDYPIVMALMVPDYDPQAFKDYHAKRAISWFKELSANFETYMADVDKAKKIQEEGVLNG